MVWNRNAENEKSVNAVVKRALESLPEEMRPQEQNYYYKKHSAHKSFGGEGKKGEGEAAKEVTGEGEKGEEKKVEGVEGSRWAEK